MSKTKRSNANSRAAIYIKYDAEKALKNPGDEVRWDMREEETLKVSSFVRKLNEYYEVPKSEFNRILGMNNRVLNKYLDIEKDCYLSNDAIERMAVCIILMMLPLNKNGEFIESCKKAGINSKGVIPTLRDDELEDLRSEFCDTFGTFGYQLTHSFKSVKKVLKLNECYYDKFSTKNKKNNDTQHN